MENTSIGSMGERPGDGHTTPGSDDKQGDGSHNPYGDSGCTFKDDLTTGHRPFEGPKPAPIPRGALKGNASSSKKATKSGCLT